eukprot:comp22004_c0_seq1/m.50521 comp22004_c0_seq1/g.50521  ORF comp22004_c0_seq1/g.50521 comp22004_c0_seq1/m.50521 type:complete len:634 (-) comp22004_c0_seq1:144-2045(-)
MHHRQDRPRAHKRRNNKETIVAWVAAVLGARNELADRTHRGRSDRDGIRVEVDPFAGRQIDIARALALGGRDCNENIAADQLDIAHRACCCIALVPVEERRNHGLAIEPGAMRQRVVVRRERIAVADVEEIGRQVAHARRTALDIGAIGLPGVRAHGDIEPARVGEPLGELFILIDFFKLALEATDIRAKVVHANHHHVLLHPERACHVLELRENVAAPHGNTVAMQPRGTRAREEPRALLEPIAAESLVQRTCPQQLMQVVVVTVLLKRRAIRARIAAVVHVVVVHLGFAKIEPESIDRGLQCGRVVVVNDPSAALGHVDLASRDQRTVLAVEPEIGTLGVGPVDHAADPPPCVLVDAGIGAHGARFGKEVAAGHFRESLGALREIGLFDDEQPNPLGPKGLCISLGIGEIDRIPEEIAHGACRRVAAIAVEFPAEPVDVQRNAIEREAEEAVLGRGEDVHVNVHVLPRAIAKDGLPEPKELFRRHKRHARESKVALAHIMQTVALNHIELQALAPGFDAPRRAAELPFLAVLGVDKEAKGAHAVARDVGHWELGALRHSLPGASAVHPKCNIAVGHTRLQQLVLAVPVSVRVAKRTAQVFGNAVDGAHGECGRELDGLDGLGHVVKVEHAQ